MAACLVAAWPLVAAEVGLAEEVSAVVTVGSVSARTPALVATTLVVVRVAAITKIPVNCLKLRFIA